MGGDNGGDIVAPGTVARRGILVRGGRPARFCFALASVGLARSLGAQLPRAEDAFKGGRLAEARAAYEQVLATDSLNLRALYRLAILDSWDGQFDRALARFVRLRRLEPQDPDFMVAHARVLSWAKRTPEALALYDTVLARSPGRADALAGRARVVAWSGDLGRAERLWREALALHPDDAELLIGLAQTLYWNDQPALARVLTARARVLAPGDPTAQDLERALRAALRPDIETSVDGAGDIDHNDFVAQEATLTGALGSALRGTLRAGWRRVTNLGAQGSSYGGGAALIVAVSPEVELRVGAGLRRLDPGVGPSRTPLTAEAGLGLRLTRDAALGVSYNRSAFDETAVLIARGYVLDAAELEFEFAPAARWSVSGGAGATWVSDGRRQLHAVGTMLAPLLPGLQLGPFIHVLGFRADSTLGGYFAPDWFLVAEARVVYTWQRHDWGLRADGGLGTQQVLRGHPHQAEWHLGFSVSRGWGANNELALVGSITNSAAATNAAHVTSEAYRYRTLGLRFRQGI
jgi:tetratricopeptide (TPR) repeat protein